MVNYIDRRLNPKDKSLSNRQRFLRRARAQLKEIVHHSVKGQSIADVGGRQTIKVPSRGVGEPRFRHAPDSGRREHVVTGNKEFAVGDKIMKPRRGRGGAGGPRATDGGMGEDDFQFTLSREEFLDIFFEDLELPDLVKTSLRETQAFKPRRAGYAVSGTPTNINILRTMRHSFGRRLALGRPSQRAIDEIERQIREIEDAGVPDTAAAGRLAALRERHQQMLRKRKVMPYIDPIDIRYNRFEQQPQPNAQAVMFCLMDVSGSMGEREKDLAKRFFIMLHLFLRRRYERIEIVFIRHTHEAQEVDEETFFHSRETGGTVVSTALEEMRLIIHDRYPTKEWNIYAAQASDGDNFSGDSDRCLGLLNEEIMPLCQYYAYVEILDERETRIFRSTETGTALWRAYQEAGKQWPTFQMKRIARPGDIYPVFRELFAKRPRDGNVPAGANSG